MQGLGKILEEVKDALKDTYLDIANNYDVSDLRYDSDKVACVAGKFRCEASERIEAIIRNHISDGWIPVKCPPEKRWKRYLVSGTGNWREKPYMVLNYHEEYEMFGEIERDIFLGDHIRGTAYRWRPLPEPYHPKPKPC